MSRREREAWEAVFGILTLVVMALVCVGLYQAAVTFVSVPLLWPIASTVGCLYSGSLVLRRAAGERRQVREAAARRLREAEHDHVRRTVAEILRRPYDGGAPVDARRRIGDAERDVITSALHSHFAAGRLDRVELDERLAVALESKTLGDLAEAVRDLPSEVTGR